MTNPQITNFDTVRAAFDIWLDGQNNRDVNMNKKKSMRWLSGFSLSADEKEVIWEQVGRSDKWLGAFEEDY